MINDHIKFTILKILFNITVVALGSVLLSLTFVDPNRWYEYAAIAIASNGLICMIGRTQWYQNTFVYNK